MQHIGKLLISTFQIYIYIYLFICYGKAGGFPIKESYHSTVFQ